MECLNVNDIHQLCIKYHQNTLHFTSTCHTQLQTSLALTDDGEMRLGMAGRGLAKVDSAVEDSTVRALELS